MDGAFAAGVYKTAARPAMDAALDVAFDDPDADRKFTGGKLSPMIFGGGAVGGMANTARWMSPQYWQDYSHVTPPAAAQAGAIGLGGGIGGFIGGAIGGAFGGLKGALRGGLIGGIGGAGLAAAPPVVLAAHRAKKNMQSGIGINRRINPNTMNLDWGAPQQDFVRNSSLRMQEKMNSSGDMVLGMYNLRRGE